MEKQIVYLFSYYLGKKLSFMADEKRKLRSKAIHKVGFVASPEFPWSYINHGSKDTSLSTKPGYGFEISIIKMDLPRPTQSGGCDLDYDFLYISSSSLYAQDNNAEYRNNISESVYCGNNRTTIMIYCNHVNINLVRTEKTHVVYNGFLLHYKGIYKLFLSMYISSGYIHRLQL